MPEQAPPVVVIIGAGGMGTAVAQRIGSGKHVLLADFSEQSLEATSSLLKTGGHQVSTQRVDVSDANSVSQLASFAKELGNLDSIVHTAGLSPTMASTAHIYAVDLVGTAHVIDAFLPVVSRGTSLICIASMAGHMSDLTPESEKFLATAEADQLLSCPAINPDSDDVGIAYTRSKRGNILRVQAFASAYGAKGARINSISPGVISTAMGEKEMSSGENGEIMKGIVAAAPAGRVGTASDIAEAVAFLAGSGASYITGTDLLVDGGVVALPKGGPSA